MKKAIYLSLITIITIVCIIAGTVIHLGGFNFGFDRDKSRSLQSEKLFPGNEKNIPAITGLEAEGEVMELEILTGDGPMVTYSGNSSLKPEVTMDGSVLRIIQKGKARNNWFGLNRIRCRVTVTLPSDLTLENLSVRANVGDVDLNGIKAIKTDLQANVGDLDLSGSELGTGAISLNTGDLDMKNCRFEDMNITNDVGDVEVTLPDPLENYSLQLSTDLGDTVINGREQSRSYTQTGSGPSLTVSSHIGDVEVKAG